MSVGHEHRLVLIGLAGPMDVVNLSLPLRGCDMEWPFCIVLTAFEI